MKYILIKENFKSKTISTELNKNFYLLKLAKQEVSLNYQKFIDKILLRELLKGLNPVLNKILTYLADEDDEGEMTGKLYDELAKQRSIILKKYDKYLSLQAKDEYLKKIRFLALELKKHLKTYTYSEEKVKSR